MTSLHTPVRIPSLEAVRDAIEVAFRENMPTALAAATAASPVLDPEGQPLVIPLTPPVSYHKAIMEDPEENGEWPTLIIISSAPRMEMSAQQQTHGAGQWRGTIEMHLWDYHDDPDVLARMLDRYGAAMWGIISGYGRFAGAWVVPETFELATSESPDSTANMRAVGLRFDVQFRT